MFKPASWNKIWDIFKTHVSRFDCILVYSKKKKKEYSVRLK